MNMDNTKYSETSLKAGTSIWVFGYGSLLWKPDISYKSLETGYIRGFQRRFWQGNVTHRGTASQVQDFFVCCFDIVDDK